MTDTNVSMQACGSWEAVKTITSDPEMVKKYANAKKSRKKFEHEVRPSSPTLSSCTD
jgi:hypothetical protein